jgi:hypothetical protein
MAYTPNTWVARAGTGLNRFSYVMDGDYIYLTPAPVSVQDPGTPFSVDWMNNIEQGITDAQNPDSLSVGETMPTGLGSGAVNAADGFYVSGSPIIDSGNNENGNWVKFSDGTMICSNKISASVAATTPIGNIYYGYAPAISFPQPFISNPVVTMGLEDNDFISTAFYGLNESGTGQYRLYVYSPNSLTKTISYYYIAIGRWK